MTVPEERTGVDPAVFREVIGHYPTGVAVATGFDGEDPIGMVIGTFSAVSLEPPLVSFMPQKSSRTYARLANAPALCINVLAHDQLSLCRTMAVPSDDKFDEVSWHVSDWHAPSLDGAVAHIHCNTHSTVEAGDHLIVLCSVEAMAVNRPVTPLLFFQGGFGGFSPCGTATRGDAELIGAIRHADSARSHVERLAHDLRCEAAALVAIGVDELTTAVSACGGTASRVTALGERVPLTPPIGEAYVAGARTEVVERWLAKVSPDEPDLVERYRSRLASVEQHGAALSIVDPRERAAYDRLRDALREYSSREPTPARERAVREALAQTRQFFEDVELHDDGTYDVGAIVVPVRSPDGDISMVVRVTQLPAGVKGRQVKDWIRTVKGAAAAVEHDLGRSCGPRSRKEGLRDQLLWYESDFPL